MEDAPDWASCAAIPVPALRGLHTGIADDIGGAPPHQPALLPSPTPSFLNMNVVLIPSPKAIPSARFARVNLNEPHLQVDLGSWA
jgi:hypothetical protein